MYRQPSDHSLKLLGTLAGAAMLGGLAIPAHAEEAPVPQSAPQPEAEKPVAAKPALEKPAAAPEPKPAKPAAEKPPAAPAPAKPVPAPPAAEKPAPPKVDAPKPADVNPEPAKPAPAAPAVKPEGEKPVASKPVPEKPAADPEGKPAPAAPAAPAPSPAKPMDTAPVPSIAPVPANPDQGAPAAPRVESHAPAPAATGDPSPDGAVLDEKAPVPKPVPPTAETPPATPPTPGAPTGKPDVPAAPADVQPTPGGKPSPAVPPVVPQSEGPGLVNAGEVPISLPDDPPGIPTVETIESLPTPPVPPTAAPSPAPVVESSVTPTSTPVAPVSEKPSDEADAWVKPTVPVKPARPSVRPVPTTRPDDDTPVRPAKPRPKPPVTVAPSVPSEPVDESASDSDASTVIDEIEPTVAPISEPVEDVIPSAEWPSPLPEPDDPIPAISSTTPAPSPVTGDVVAGPRVSIDENVEQRPPMSGLIPVVELAPTLAESPTLFTEAESADLVGPGGSPSPDGQRESRVVLRDVVSHLAVAQQSVAGFTPVEMADMDASRPIDSDLIAVRYRVGEGETLHQIAGQLFALDVLDVETVEEAYQLLLTINELDQDAKVVSGDEVLVPLSRSRLARAKESLDLTGDGLWTLRVDATKRIMLDRREALPNDSE